MRNLSNKTAVILGASYGIGRAFSIALSKEGCNLVLVARNLQGLEETKQMVMEREDGTNNIDIHCFSLDLGKTEDIKSFDAFLSEKKIDVDILWNGAFGWIEGELESNPLDKLEDFIDSSIKGNLMLTRYLLPKIQESSLKQIINIVADWEFPMDSGLTAFIVGKRMMSSLGKAIQKDNNGRIRVTNMHPADVASSSEYSIDSKNSDVLSKNKNSMISLADITDIAIFAIKMETAILHEINIKPLNQKIDRSY